MNALSAGLVSAVRAHAHPSSRAYLVVRSSSTAFCASFLSILGLT
jgi:hypothetical protein